MNRRWYAWRIDACRQLHWYSDTLKTFVQISRKRREAHLRKTLRCTARWQQYLSHNIDVQLWWGFACTPTRCKFWCRWLFCTMSCLTEPYPSIYISYSITPLYRLYITSINHGHGCPYQSYWSFPYNCNFATQCSTLGHVADTGLCWCVGGISKHQICTPISPSTLLLVYSAGDWWWILHQIVSQGSKPSIPCVYPLVWESLGYSGYHNDTLFHQKIIRGKWEIT